MTTKKSATNSKKARETVAKKAAKKIGKKVNSSSADPGRADEPARAQPFTIGGSQHHNDINPATPPEPALAAPLSQEQPLPLANVPSFVTDIVIEGELIDGNEPIAPNELVFGLHDLPRPMWPDPTSLELARIVVECGWADDSNGPRRAMDFLWRCSRTKHDSLISVERLVSKVESEAPKMMRKLTEEIGRDHTNLNDPMFHPEFMRLFKTTRLTIGGKKIGGVELLDHWIMLPDEINHLSRHGLAHLRDDLPIFHDNMKTHGTRAEDWSPHAPYQIDWQQLVAMVREFKEWRNKRAKEGIATGVQNLLRGNAMRNESAPETTSKPTGETAPAGKTNQVMKVSKANNSTREKEITSTEAKGITAKIDAAVNSHGFGKRGPKARPPKPTWKLGGSPITTGMEL